MSRTPSRHPRPYRGPDLPPIEKRIEKERSEIRTRAWTLVKANIWIMAIALAIGLLAGSVDGILVPFVTAFLMAGGNIFCLNFWVDWRFAKKELRWLLEGTANPLPERPPTEVSSSASRGIHFTS